VPEPTNRPRKKTTERKKTGPPPRTDWQEPFLEQFEAHGVQAWAARQADVTIKTIHKERARSEEFNERYEAALEQSTSTLERQGYQWGAFGLVNRTTKTVTKPDGTVTTTITESTERSPALLIFMLKARKPDVYRDNVLIEQSGSLEVTVPKEQGDAAVSAFDHAVVRLADARRAREGAQGSTSG
jgi:hypothetical protein